MALRSEPVSASPIVIGEEETSHGRRFQRRYLHERQVAVGGTASGNIETAGDRDWFAVELVAGRTYTFDLRGSPTADGTLSDPFLYGIHDADGNRFAHTMNDDGGDGRNSKVTFTATETGTHYIAAGAYRLRLGTYELEVVDTSPADTESPPDTTTDTTPTPDTTTDTTTPTDADATRAGATELGDITALAGPRFPRGWMDGDTDQVDYYRFTLTEAKRVDLGLRHGNLLHCRRGRRNLFGRRHVLRGGLYGLLHALRGGGHVRVPALPHSRAGCILIDLRRAGPLTSVLTP